jgi:MYXO-CTERM domain-containing protein
VSSTLNWQDRGLALTQTTDLPLTNKVTLTITAAPTDAVNIQFRKPDWAAGCATAVAVNGQTVTPTDANGFLGVSRVWQANDKIELALPFVVQASRLPDNANAVAFTYGPLVLSAGLGTAAMTTMGHAWTIAATSPGGLQDTIKIPSGTVNDWLSNIQKNLVQTPGKLEFKLKNTDSDDKLVFLPHYSRYQDRYGIYWKLSGGAGGTTSMMVTCPAVTAGGPGGSVGMDAGAGRGGSGAGGVASGGASGGSAQGGQPASGTGGSGASSTGQPQASGGTITSTGGQAGGPGGQLVGGTGGTTGTGDGSSGCSCQLAATDTAPSGLVALLLGIGTGGLRRRRRH